MHYNFFLVYNVLQWLPSFVEFLAGHPPLYHEPAVQSYFSCFFYILLHHSPKIIYTVLITAGSIKKYLHLYTLTTSLVKSLLHLMNTTGPSMGVCINAPSISTLATSVIPL